MVHPVVALSRLGILAVRAAASASGGSITTRRTLELRKVVRLSAIINGYKSKEDGRFYRLEFTRAAVFNPAWRPERLDPNNEGEIFDQSGASYMLDISPFDTLRLVDREVEEK